jgi:hypothetical protein
MDDPTRWCENDTGNETRPSGPRIPNRGPFSYEFFDFLTAVHYSNKPAKPSPLRIPMDCYSPIATSRLTTA